MLEVDNLSVCLGGSPVLKGINLAVMEGELVVLLGANGAGKSTLLRTISGLVRPSAGSVRYRGKKISGLGPSQIVRQGISQCAEGRKLFPRMSVHKNLILGAYTRRRDKTGVAESLAYVCRLFPVLEAKGHVAAGSLSGGEQQMLTIARALMCRPAVLLLDEPSTGLAPQVVRQVFETIAAINREGTTILLAEQNAHSALMIAGRGYVIEDGAVVMADTSGVLAADDRVRQAYIGA